MFIIFIWKWQFTPVFLSGKFHGQRSLAGYSPWSRKELDMTENAHMQRFNTRVHGIPTTTLCGSTVASPVFSGKIIKAQRS